MELPLVSTYIPQWKMEEMEEGRIKLLQILEFESIKFVSKPYKDQHWRPEK